MVGGGMCTHHLDTGTESGCLGSSLASDAAWAALWQSPNNDSGVLVVVLVCTSSDNGSTMATINSNRPRTQRNVADTIGHPENKAIRKIGKCNWQVRFFCHYFPIPKQHEGQCLILDTMRLNKFVPWNARCWWFQGHNKAINGDEWFATVDLNGAYFQMSIWECHWHFPELSVSGQVLYIESPPLWHLLSLVNIHEHSICTSLLSR